MKARNKSIPYEERLKLIYPKSCKNFYLIDFFSKKYFGFVLLFSFYFGISKIPEILSTET